MKQTASERGRLYRKRHPDRVAASARKYMAKRRSKHRAAVVAAKSVPCADCGGTFDPVCMDFDHRDGVEKLKEVSRLVYTTSVDVVLAEIAKCDVVCANCHRLRSKARGIGRRKAKP